MPEMVKVSVVDLGGRGPIYEELHPREEIEGGTEPLPLEVGEAARMLSDELPGDEVGKGLLLLYEPDVTPAIPGEIVHIGWVHRGYTSHSDYYVEWRCERWGRQYALCMVEPEETWTEGANERLEGILRRQIDMRNRLGLLMRPPADHPEAAR